MRLRSDIKMAVASLRSMRWRSMLTTLGIIIGVASVVTTVSLGEGVRKQVLTQISHQGHDLITIRPGTAHASFSLLGGSPVNGILNDNDYQTIKNTVGLKFATPLSIVNGIAQNDDGQQYPNGFIVATSSDLPAGLNQNVRYGSFFGPDELNKHIAVVGQRVARELFGQTVPLGAALQIHGEKFIVGGVFDQIDISPLSGSVDYNNAIFIPYDIGRTLNGDQAQIYQVLARPSSPRQLDAVVQRINQRLYDAHGQQQDVNVLKASDNAATSNHVFDLLTTLTASIAAISLIVGGIGIMNIMLASVIERTHEIGVRKAVGATNRQILNQFVTEAGVLSVIGGVLGIILAFIVDYFIRLLTDIQPSLSWSVMLIALLAALLVGMFFGIAPAVKAASRDPIEALRHE